MSTTSELIYHYFPQFSSQQKEQIDRLQALYEEWNTQINVVSRKDIDSLYERHVLHSLSIFHFLQFKEGSHILDIGTGGGFPGIPLAIAHPEAQFVLSDSIGKKIKVVQGVADALGLKNVTAIHERSEKIKGQFDFVVSRAVADISELVKWSNGKIKKQQQNALPNGLICLKGGDLKEELAPYKKRVQTFDLKDYFQEEFFETKKLVYLPMV
jgi:16S rRNA (guanine527-N7)-methyltransferase